MKGKLQEHMGQAGVRRGERWQTRTLDQEPASGRAMAPGLGRKGLQGLPELLHSSLPHSLPALLPHLPLPLLLRIFSFPATHYSPLIFLCPFLFLKFPFSLSIFLPKCDSSFPPSFTLPFHNYSSTYFSNMENVGGGVRKTLI